MTEHVTERRHARLARLNTAAAYVDQSRTTYWRHTRAGIWPEPVDVGGIPMVDLDEIDTRIEALKTARSSQGAA